MHSLPNLPKLMRDVLKLLRCIF